MDYRYDDNPISQGGEPPHEIPTEPITSQEYHEAEHSTPVQTHYDDMQNYYTHDNYSGQNTYRADYQNVSHESGYESPPYDTDCQNVPHESYYGHDAYANYDGNYANAEQNEQYSVYTPKPQKKRNGLKIAGVIAIAVVCAFIGGFTSQFFLKPSIGITTELPEATPLPTIQVTPAATPEPEPIIRPDELPELGGENSEYGVFFNPVPDIADSVSNSVVQVDAYTLVYDADGNPSEQLISRGTGFVISSEGYIVTNHHVIADASVIKVIFNDSTEYEARNMGVDATMDVGVLRIDKAGLTAIPIGDSDEVRAGELAIVVGNPGGAGAKLTNSVTVGYISSVERELMFNGVMQDFIQTDAAINPGNSGGPLINDRGEVIGMNTLKSLLSSYNALGEGVESEGLGFAIPINLVIETSGDIILNGTIKKPGIGIRYRLLSYEEAQELGSPVGVRVESFTVPSTAQDAGLEVGDIIIECEGQKLTETSILADIVTSNEIGDVITVELWRDGQTLSYDITIGDINEMS